MEYLKTAVSGSPRFITLGNGGALLYRSLLGIYFLVFSSWVQWKLMLRFDLWGVH